MAEMAEQEAKGQLGKSAAFPIAAFPGLNGLHLIRIQLLDKLADEQVARREFSLCVSQLLANLVMKPLIPPQIPGGTGSGLGEAFWVRRNSSHVSGRPGKLNQVKLPVSPITTRILRIRSVLGHLLSNTRSRNIKTEER
jgi:hypothetical protein